MSELTQRQKQILDKIIWEYVRSAKPVSSRLIERKYAFDIKPATIRREFASLTEAGLVEQPHTSAGRVPTDKAYRLFVDELLELLEQDSEQAEPRANAEQLQVRNVDNLHILWQLARDLAEASSALVVARLLEDELEVCEGWSRVIRQPEFTDQRSLLALTRVLDQLGQRMDDLAEELPSAGLRVFIGKECGLASSAGLSLMFTGSQLGQQHAILALVGPKRMDYARNIRLIKELTALLNV